MNYTILLPGIIIFTTVLLAMTVLLANPQSTQNRLLFSIILLSSIWVTSSLLADHAASLSVATFWAKFAIVPPAFVLCLLLYFSISFPVKSIIGSQKTALIFLPAVFYLALSPTSLNIRGISLKSWGADYIPGFLYQLFTPFCFVYLMLAFLNFSSSYIKGDSTRKAQIKFILLGLTLAFLIGIITNVLLPFLGIAQIAVIGPSISVLLLSAFMTYAILKHHLFNIKVIASEVLTFVIGFLLLLQVFIADSGRSRLAHEIIFALFAFFGILLIRSVINEVKQRDHLRLLTEQLEATNGKLKEADRLKTEFLSLATHQLRSPLTVILGKASMLLDGSYGLMRSEEQREEINHIFQSARNLIHLIEDLLNISKIEQGGMQYEMTDVELNKLLQEVFEELTPLAKNKGLQLTLETSNDALWLKADALKLRQAIMNLIDNAVKYTERGFVRVSLSQTRHTATIKIEDSGIGMTDDTIKSLFQKFSRGEGSNINLGGSGLGLYLAKEIIAAHNGNLHAESKGKGYGSMFVIELPMSIKLKNSPSFEEEFDRAIGS